MPRGQSTRSRWADAARIAQVLDIPKSKVFSYLMNEIVEAGLLAHLKAGDAASIETLKHMPCWEQMQRADNVRIHHPDGPMDAISQIKVACWFIQKIGSREQAIKAIEAASLALERIENER